MVLTQHKKEQPYKDVYQNSIHIGLTKKICAKFICEKIEKDYTFMIYSYYINEVHLSKSIETILFSVFKNSNTFYHKKVVKNPF